MKLNQALIAMFALAVVASADNFANFFDDDNCSVNGGIGVNIDNDGCLTESGRGSVYIPNSGSVFDYCLVTTGTAGGCRCQSGAYEFTSTGYCQKLNKNDKSYRFISENCGDNNC